MKYIAVLLTCHNRKDKTIQSLKALFKSFELYNTNCEIKNEQYRYEVFVTDDGCTDGTTDAILCMFPHDNIHILKGNGNLFWAGGMRMAWKAAINANTQWDYFFLLNDDTEVLPNCLKELFDTCKYGIMQKGKEGIVSGLVSSKTDSVEVTYGGDVWIDKWTARRKRIIPQGKPVFVDMTNANILLVHSSVVNKIGIFYEGYRHGHADFDYSNQARKAGFPVLLTGNVCGLCENDHGSYEDNMNKVISMTFKERKIFFSNPLHSSSDYLCYIRRNVPIRYPFVLIGRFLNECFPQIYYKLNRQRIKNML